MNWKDEKVISSPIPISADQLPQQRISEVISMPPRPKGLITYSEFIDYYPDYPVSTPRKTLFLGGVEWAWSPMHSRIDNYYLNAKPKYWVIWNHWLNDNETPWHWQWDIFAYAPKIKGDEKSIAMHMLKETWQMDKLHNYVDEFHWINSTGLFSVSDFAAIAREVW